MFSIGDTDDTADDEIDNSVLPPSEIMRPKVRVQLTPSGNTIVVAAKESQIKTSDCCGCLQYASPTMTTATVWSEMYKMFTLFSIIATIVFALSSGMSLNQIITRNVIEYSGSGSSDSNSHTELEPAVMIDNKFAYVSTIL